MVSSTLLVWVAASVSYFHSCDCVEAPKADVGYYMRPDPPGKTEYVIGGWNPGGTIPDFLHRFEPIFQDYLTNQIGPLHNPPINFKLIPTDWTELGNETTTAHMMIEEGELDFTFTDGGYLTCIEDHLHVSPIATLQESTFGIATSSLIYSLASNSKIKNVSHFNGKRIGFGHKFSSGFHLGAEVIFYSGDYVRQMEDIQRGNLDVAVVTSGFLEEFYPAYVTSGIFRFHLVTTPMYQGEPYPFLTSTEVVPGFALAASAHVTPLVREQVYLALSNLNAAHPLSVAAGITGFVAHSSYELSRTFARKSGVMFATEEKDPLGHNRNDCHAPWEPHGDYWAVFCPDGYLLDTLESAELACERSHLYCPADLVCLCRPCIKDMVLLMYPVQVVLGLCVVLFVGAISFALCWRLPLEFSHVVTGLRRSTQGLAQAHFSSNLFMTQRMKDS